MSLEIEWLETLIKRKERERCVERALKMTVGDAVGKFANFLSAIKRVKMDVILSNGDKTTQSFIVKTQPPGELHGTYVMESKVFVTEIKMYDIILKGMKRLMIATGDREETSWCEMIGYEPFQTIVFEDLCELGYRVIDMKKQMMDLETSRLIVSSLGRYHALTLAALKNDVFNVNEYVETPYCDETFVNRNLNGMLSAASEVIDSSWGPKWKETARRIKLLTETLQERLVALARNDNDEIKVLNHGDFWSGNIMVKFDRIGRPVGVKFIDFQLCHYNSFAWDLTHFLYSSVEPTIRRQHFKELLEAYLISRNEYSKLYCGDTTSAISLKVAQQEMERFRLLGFIVLTSLFPSITSELDNLFDIEAWASTEDTPLKINEGIFTSTKYKNYVQKDFELFVSDGVI